MDRFYSTLEAAPRTSGRRTGLPAPRGNRSGKDREVIDQLQGLRERFCEAMDDDFNTARAIGFLFDTVRLFNASLAGKKTVLSPDVLAQAEKALREIGAVLGLFGEEPDDYLRRDREREAAKRGLAVAEIEALDRRAAGRTGGQGVAEGR